MKRIYKHSSNKIIRNYCLKPKNIGLSAELSYIEGGRLNIWSFLGYNIYKLCGDEFLHESIYITLRIEK